MGSISQNAPTVAITRSFRESSRAGAGGRIVVVDDSSTNLLLLEDILVTQGHQVQSFTRGAPALAAIERQPPDLIVLDVSMPEITGYELCAQLKATPQLAEIPVIFISALNESGDVVQGFRSGGEDYISKPFQAEEVLARVETHLKLRRALMAERDLLERTLNGAVAAVLELIQATSPSLVARSNSLRDIVVTAAKGIELKDFWQYELAAMLALVGCIAIPEEVFEKAWGGGETLTPDESAIFQNHPEVGARLLLNIPRLEDVAQIIRLQQTVDGGASPRVKLGVQLLHLALELDQRIYHNMEVRDAIQVLRDSGHFPHPMLDALNQYYPMEAPFDLRQVAVHEVSSGMILDEDVVSSSTNALIFKAGMVFTDLWVERLGNFARNHGVQRRIRVRVPRLAKHTRLGNPATFV